MFKAFLLFFTLVVFASLSLSSDRAFAGGKVESRNTNYPTAPNKLYGLTPDDMQKMDEQRWGK